jgi:hypothetical protein
VQSFAAFAGALYLILGLAGFVPPLWDRPPAHAPALQVTTFHASLFGFFTVNVAVSAIHLALGLWGNIAAESRHASLIFARAGAVIFVTLGVAGLIPIQAVSTLYGTVPLSGYNAWLYLATGLVAMVFAFGRSGRAPPAQRVVAGRRRTRPRPAAR